VAAHPEPGPITLQFPLLAEVAGVGHAVFGRRGGVSRPPFESLNVGLAVGDRARSVWRNRRIILSRMGFSRGCSARQVHGTRILVHTHRGDPALSPAGEGDALITNIPGELLLIQVADCQAVLLCDPLRRVVANIHAGWRGSVAGIVEMTVRRMGEVFGSRPADLIAAVSPSLGPCCAEFVHFRREIPAPLWGYRRGEHHFDFWAITRDQLIASGVPSERIETSGVCTRCRGGDFFSYRREKLTGRFAAVIGLAEEGGKDEK
jgi:YfiH family protein